MVMEAQAVSCDLCLHRQEKRHPDRDVCSRSGLYQTCNLCGLTGELVQLVTASVVVISLGATVGHEAALEPHEVMEASSSATPRRGGGSSCNTTEVMTGAPFSLAPWRVDSLR